MSDVVGYDESADFDSAARNFEEKDPKDIDYSDIDYGHMKEKLEQPDKISGKKFLSKNEEGASDKPNIAGKGGDKKASLGEKEGNVTSTNGAAKQIKNNVLGAAKIERGNFKGAIAMIRHGGPTGVVVGILMLSLMFVYMAQGFTALSFVSMLTTKTDSISISTGLRSPMFLKYQLSKWRDKACAKANMYSKDNFRVSDFQRKQFSKSNIIFNEKGTDMMYYPRDGGEAVHVVMDASDANGGNVKTFKEMKKNAEFRKDYKSGTRRWNSLSAAWHNSRTRNLLSKIGIASRNTFREYDANSPDAPEQMRKIFENNITTDSPGAKSEATELESKQTQDNDDNMSEEVTGSTKKATPTENETGDAMKITSQDAAERPKMRVKLKNIVGSAIKSSSAVANFYCAFADGVGAINMVTAAAQTLQVIQLAQTFLEGTQKVTEDEKNSPYDRLSQAMVEPAENTFVVKTTLKKDASSTNEFIEDEEETITRTRSGTEANAVTALFEDKSADPDDPSVASLNSKNMLNKMWKSLGDNSSGVIGALVSKVGLVASNVSAGRNAFRSCTIARITGAAVGLVSAGISLATDISICAASKIACVLTLGKKLLGQLAKAAVKAMIVSAIVGMVISHVTGIFNEHIEKNLKGENFLNGIYSGDVAMQTRNHLNDGGGLMDKAAYGAYLQARDEYLAEEAEYERATKSPFDASSNYTFLGSLLNRFRPIASHMTSITSAINGFGTMVGNAISSFTPRSSAVSAGITAEAAKELTTEADPDLADIGGISDAFGNALVGTDTTTMGVDPADVVNHISDELEDPATADTMTPVIKEDSNLAKFIYYCGQRQSPFGVADQNIATEVSGDVTAVGSSIGQATLSSIPVFSDIADIISGGKKLDNIGWITGQSCVINSKIDKDQYESSSDWDTNKYYQRFIEDQSLAEAQGLIEESSVTQLLAKYYEKHPIDYSYEGMLARFSGLTKDNVIVALDLIDMAKFVVAYNPEKMYPYPAEEHESAPINLDSEYYEFSNDMLAMHDVIYDNNRYRNFAA